MRFRYTIAILVLTSLVVVMAGCGGGGGGSSLQDTGVAITIGADAAVSAAIPKSRDTTIESPLDAGADVTVYSFETGDVLATGKLDASGLCTLRIPPRLTVAVVVTGQREGKPYRLSTIIPSVPTTDSTVVANPVTSLASEAIAQKAFAQNLTIDQETLDTVLAAAAEYVGNNPEADYSLEGNVFTGSAADFGQAAGLNADEVQDVIDSVPAEAYDRVAAAKNAVRQIQEAGLPLNAMLMQERPDIEGVFTEAVAEKYSALVGRLSLLALPALFDEFYLEDESRYVGLTDLALDHVYGIMPDEDWCLVEITDGTYYQPEAGKVVILAYDQSEDVVYRAVASKSGSNWTIVQTSEADAELEYTIVVTDIESIPAANPSVTLTANLVDSTLTDSIVFNGTISAVGADQDSYTQVTVSGQLTSDEITSGGTFQANFPATKPAGADPDQMTYEFPTSFHSENAQIAFTNGETTITLSGRIAATMVVLNTPDGPISVPNHIELEGGYTNSNSGLSFEGSIVGNWTNPGLGLNETTVVGTVVLDGNMTRAGHPTYRGTLAFGLNNGTATCAIDLQVGTSTLVGQATAQLRADQPPASASLELRNQSDVVFTLNAVPGGAEGEITKGGEKAADITIAGSILRIDYTDQTFQEFPL